MEEAGDEVDFKGELGKAMEKCTRLERELKDTQDQQRLLSSTAGGIYEAADWMTSHLGKTVQELSFLVQRLDKVHAVYVLAIKSRNG